MKEKTRWHLDFIMLTVSQSDLLCYEAQQMKTPEGNL